MNAVSLSASFRLAQMQNDGAGILVMKKAMDNLAQEGNNMVQLLASLPSLQTGLGQNVDIRV